MHMGNPVVQHDGDHLDLVAPRWRPRAWSTREPCTGAALRITAAAVPAWRVISMLVPIACRSATDARHGIRTRSAARPAASAASVECGAVSMMARSASASRAAVSRAGSWSAWPEMTGGGISDAETRPRRGRTLWVKVNQRCCEPCSLAGDGKAARERCLPCAALPADECDREHWIANISYYIGYIFIIDITLNRISESRRAGRGPVRRRCGAGQTPRGSQS